MVLITKSSDLTLKIGEVGPDFNKVPGTDGKKHSLRDFQGSKAIVISFTCNHCPYAQAYEDRFIALAREFAPKKIAFVAINSNEDQHYPEDSFQNMLIRSQEKQFPFPYLRDESQKIAKAYGAVCTPHLFLLDHKYRLLYEGRIDDNWKEPEKASTHDLRLAIESVLAGKPVPVARTNPMGCSIKWKNQTFSTLIHKRH